MNPLERHRDARVVILDDQPENVLLLQRLLLANGLEHVQGFTDPREVVATFEHLDPDLLLLDLHMPHLDGYEVLTEVRRRAAGTFLPVLVQTADSTPEAMRRALDAGATDVITKPVNLAEVVLRARNALQTRQLYRGLAAQNATLLDRVALLEPPDLTDVHAQTRDRIRQVLDAGGPRIVYQPVVDLTDGSPVGHEALSRFPEGTPGPQVWFGEALSVGMDGDLEMAAVQQAIAGAATLPGGAFLAVNVSPATLVTGRLVSAAEQHPGLVIELTESLPVEDYDLVAAAMRPLRRHGVRLAMDDTGAGYAGLRHLLNLSPDIIKLDISLVRGIQVDPVRRALAAALLAFARDVGAVVVAEGVERAEEELALRGLGVRWAQGFRFSAPDVPAELVV